MSNLFKRVAALAGATRNKRHDSCRSPFFLSRGIMSAKPVTGIPALNARNIAHPALQFIALFLIIEMSMITMFKPAQASGMVTKPPGTNFLATTSFVVYNPPATIAGGNAAKHACDYRFTTHNAFGACMLSQTAEGAYYAPVQSAIHGAVYTYKLPNHGQYKFNYTWNNASICPVNSTGSTTCTCNDGYEPDPTATRCVLEQYTISLSGLGVEVMPTKKLETAYALVTKSTGTPKSGVNVDLLLTVEPENGTPVRAEHVGNLSPNGGRTDADGKLPFVFTAPTAGGISTITAACTSCTHIYVQGTIRVPGCPIPPLTAPPFTDPVAQGFENGNRWRPDLLTAGYQTKLACVQDAITAKNGTYSPTSAYRPTEYQQHLFEIVKKDKKLDIDYMTAHPECQALRVKVTAEMGGHGLKSKQLVAEPGTSRHESGTAFDLTPSGLTEAQLTVIYTDCKVTHTAVSSEPW